MGYPSDGCRRLDADAATLVARLDEEGCGAGGGSTPTP